MYDPMPPSPVPVSVVVPVLNESRNLPAALASVSWAGQVIVVDSHSTDGTAELARRLGAEVVPFQFTGHGPRKKNWALATLPFRYEWVLLLDADERVPPPLQAAIIQAVRANRADGYYLDREGDRSAACGRIGTCACSSTGSVASRTWAWDSCPAPATTRCTSTCD